MNGIPDPTGKCTIASILHEAIGILERRNAIFGASEYSCDAVQAAITAARGRGFVVDAVVVFRFLRELGCSPGDSHLYDDLKDKVGHYSLQKSEKSQKARTLWLTWAEMIAAEEDLCAAGARNG